MATAERLAGWMRRQLTSSGGRGFVVGLSGGIDSAVVARLAQLAARSNVLAASCRRTATPPTSATRY